MENPPCRWIFRFTGKKGQKESRPYGMSEKELQRKYGKKRRKLKK